MQRVWQENKELIALIGAILALLLAGAFFSPSFSQKIGFLQLFFMTLGMLFVTATLIVFAILGFRSFAFFMAAFLGVVLLLDGVWGAVLVVGLSYLAWGFVFALEVLLVDNGVESAVRWFQKRYDFRSFRIEYYAFYPMILLFHLLLERIPSLFLREKIVDFNPSRVLEKMQEVLRS